MRVGMWKRGWGDAAEELGQWRGRDNAGGIVQGGGGVERKGGGVEDGVMQGGEVLISIDVTFDESSMLLKKEQLIDARKDHGVWEKKSLYGLKQSPREWYKWFDTFMAERGYTESAYDSCVYPQRLMDSSHIYLLLYVDDMLTAAKMISIINGLREQLKTKFEMEDLGSAKRLLGMEIQRSTCKNFVLVLEKYIELKLQRFGMDNSKPAIIALSTTEAEYIMATETVKEAIWLKGLVGDLGLKQESSTVHCKSQSAICLTKNQMFHERTKHIDLKDPLQSFSTQKYGSIEDIIVRNAYNGAKRAEREIKEIIEKWPMKELKEGTISSLMLKVRMSTTHRKPDPTIAEEWLARAEKILDTARILNSQRLLQTYIAVVDRALAIENDLEEQKNVDTGLFRAPSYGGQKNRNSRNVNPSGRGQGNTWQGNFQRALQGRNHNFYGNGQGRGQGSQMSSYTGSGASFAESSSGDNNKGRNQTEISNTQPPKQARIGD
ncbi:hypothetical protein RJ639_042884 [Escallonia herrerae]|uniref:Reverse transcriptase Ty1/copia-type domain-containing protein n=1 Tax=Escallonia herrerae TaxID=1293975 RepID=A0AA88WBZ4_9ASTE|nr:hypothetical protein RJ639_042884 [Escallonia herrerae]